jgi:hypothetical protein
VSLIDGRRSSMRRRRRRRRSSCRFDTVIRIKMRIRIRIRICTFILFTMLAAGGEKRKANNELELF